MTDDFRGFVQVQVAEKHFCNLIQISSDFVPTSLVEVDNKRSIFQKCFGVIWTHYDPTNWRMLESPGPPFTNMI